MCRASLSLESALQMSAVGMVSGVLEAVTEVPLSGASAGTPGRDACGRDPCSCVHGGSSPLRSRPLIKCCFLLSVNLSERSRERVNRWI